MSLRYIAASLGLSVTTVSRALAGYPDVAEETRLRVRTEADRIGYVPNATARRLQKGRTDAIGVVAPAGIDAISDTYLYAAFTSAWSRLSELDLDLVLLPSLTGTSTRETEIRSFRRAVEERRVDGLLLLRTQANDWRIPYLQAAGVPFVVFGSDHDGMPGVTTVAPDNDDAARQVMRRLARFGHRRVACIAPEGGYDFVVSRIVALEREAGREGLEMRSVPARFCEDGGRQTTALLLDDRPMPTAMIYLANRLAIGGLQAFAESRLVLGRHVSAISFGDNSNLRFASPPVTAIRTPVAEMVAHAIDLLLARFDNRTTEPIRRWPVVLIERRSDGPLEAAPAETIPTDAIPPAATTATS